MPWDDAKLVEALKSRDSEAVQYAVETYVPKLYRYGMYELKDHVAAEDLASEVIMRMLEKIDTFVYTGVPLQMWLFRIARNLVTDHYRRKSKMGETSLELWLEENDGHHPSATDTGVELLGEREMLREALAHLTGEQRQVLMLRLIEGWQPAEIAELLGRSVDSVKSLQYRALQSLRRYLDNEMGSTMGKVGPE